MKKIGKILLAISLVVVLGLTACSNKSGNPKEKLKIGILQIVEHGSLDATREGFIAELPKQGLGEEEVEITVMNAQGDQANLKTMSEKLIKENDLVFAIATPTAQALLNETKDTPIIFAAVTDPIDAGLVQTLDVPGGNVTGVTDHIDVSKQTGLITSINPDAKKVGIIYNPGEANSAQQVKEATAAFKKQGIEVVETTVNTTNDIQSAMESLVKQVDAIYIPTDNTLASGMVTVGSIAKTNKIPVIPGSGEMALDGGLATYGVDYAETGAQAAALAKRILVDQEDITVVSVEEPKNLNLVINEDMASALGVDTSKL